MNTKKIFTLLYLLLFMIGFLGTLYVRADSNRILDNEGKVEEASLYVPDAIQSLFKKLPGIKSKNLLYSRFFLFLYIIINGVSKKYLL